MTTPSSEKLWTLRPYKGSDKDFVCFSYNASTRFGPIGLRMGAHKDKDAAKRHWLMAQRIIDRLLEKCQCTVAEAIVDDVPVICGYVIGEEDVILHYVLTRRSMFRQGVASDLLTPWLQSATPTVYSHLPSVKGLQIPEGWIYDAGAWLKWFH